MGKEDHGLLALIPSSLTVYIYHILPRSAYLSVLKMEAGFSSETSIPDDTALHPRRH
jgi:hypothetical protein